MVYTSCRVGGDRADFSRRRDQKASDPVAIRAAPAQLDRRAGQKFEIKSAGNQKYWSDQPAPNRSVPGKRAFGDF